jgi:hypothetical protein
MEPNQGGIKTWQWVVTVIVIIILIILGYNMFKGGSTPTITEDEPASINTIKTGDINRVVVSDQFPGNIVYLSSVQLAQPGWVVIHKDNAGTPGAVIGSAYFEKGISPGKITLTSPTVEGGIYYAMIHSDNGDKKFDAVKDLPLKDASGNIIMKLFRASTSVTEVKG